MRGLLILRIGWLCRSEYEWAAHAPAGRRAGLSEADFARIVAAPSPLDSVSSAASGAVSSAASGAVSSAASGAVSSAASGATAPDTSDAQLLRAVDELHRDDVISDATWNALAASFDTRQLLDTLTTIGGYRMVSMALNTFGVQLEPGAERFPLGSNSRRSFA